MFNKIKNAILLKPFWLNGGYLLLNKSTRHIYVAESYDESNPNLLKLDRLFTIHDSLDFFNDSAEAYSEMASDLEVEYGY